MAVDVLGDIVLEGGNLPIVPRITRELSLDDLGLVPAKGESVQPTVRALRESHHRLARLVASGLKGVEVCAISGYSQSRLSILKKDPAFIELVAHYTEIKNSQFADLQGQIASFGADALSVIRDRLEDDPDSFRNTELLEVINSMLDRSGHGRTSKVESTSVHIGTAELMELKKKAKEVQKGHVTNKLEKTIEHTSSSSKTEVG